MMFITCSWNSTVIKTENYKCCICESSKFNCYSNSTHWKNSSNSNLMHGWLLFHINSTGYDSRKPLNISCTTSAWNVGKLLEDLVKFVPQVTTLNLALKGSKNNIGALINITMIQYLRRLKAVWFLKGGRTFGDGAFGIEFTRSENVTSLPLEEFHLQIPLYEMKPKQVRILTLDKMKGWPIRESFILPESFYKKSSWTAFQELFSVTNNLKVLDLSDTEQFQFGFLKESLQALEGAPVEKIYLKNIQKPGYYKHSLLLSMDIFKPMKNTLEYLDLRYNYISNINASPLYEFPKLKVVLLSHNALPSKHELDYIYWFVHKPLTLLDISSQGTLSCVPGKNCQSEKDTFYDQTWKPEASPTESFDVLYQYIRFNEERYPKHFQTPEAYNQYRWELCKAYYNYTGLIGSDNYSLTCKLINCLAVYTFEIPCSWWYLTKHTPSDIVDFSCNGGIKFPIGENIEAIKVDNFYDNQRTNFDPKPLLHWKNMKFCFGKNRLRKLSLSSTFWIMLNKWVNLDQAVDYRITGLDSLEELDASQNDVDLSMSLKVMFSFKALKRINLSGNIISSFEQFSDVCDHLPNLEHLDFSFCKINYLHFSYVRCNQLQSLNLAGNNFQNVESLFITPGPNLKMLNFSHCGINYLSDQAREEIITSSLSRNHTSELVIDFSSNRIVYQCSIDASIRFIKWIRSNTRNLIWYNNQTYMSNGDSELVRNIDLAKLDSECHPSYLAYILSPVFLLSLCIAGILIYIKRWKVCYYMVAKPKTWLCSCCSRKGGAHNNGRSYVFDIFVSYSFVDRYWVHNVLVKELEDKYGFCLCIHIRNFIPGRKQDLKSSIYMSIFSIHKVCKKCKI